MLLLSMIYFLFIIIIISYRKLDWKRCFGLHMWYYNTNDSPISKIVETYDNAVQKGLCCPPIPPYLEVFLT